MLTTRQHGISSDEKFEAWSLNQDQIEPVWSDMAPLIAKSLEHAHGQYSLEDIHQGLLQGMFIALGLSKEGKLHLLFIVQVIDWPQYRSVCMLAVATDGISLRKAHSFWPAFEAWCLCRGAVEIEAWCRPAITRLLRPLGFKKASDVVRYDMRGKLQ